MVWRYMKKKKRIPYRKADQKGHKDEKSTVTPKFTLFRSQFKERHSAGKGFQSLDVSGKKLLT